MNAAHAGYKPELDGIRALCILFTMANHIPGTPWAINGSVGVDIFFALSGWLITWLLIHDTTVGKAAKLSSYYIRASSASCRFMPSLSSCTDWRR
ncbi:hypothetical protein [Metarhizobium album]|uniref:hypothetical protein n=1 Tax=Metarhizobium album TaxID=2182425 RepID=UPI000FFE636B|nr:hypothetical protein [Rhizobium album]